MDLLGLLLLATLSGIPRVQDTAASASTDAWEETWRALEAMSRSAPGSAARRQAAAELESFRARRDRSARRRHDRAEAFRSRVLGAQLALLAESPFRPVSDPRVPIAWLPGEAWIAAQVAGPGPTRVAAIQTALAETRTAELTECIRLAFTTATDDARALHLDESEQVARALHERVETVAAGELPAEHRSGTKAAVLLALVSRLKGEHSEALAVLEPRLRSTSDPADRQELLVEIGRASTAAGQNASAGRALGEALAIGSPDAGWLLGRSALCEAVVPRARALFRTLISNSEARAVPPPALRGYGLSLLSSAGSTLPSTRN